MEYPRVYDQSMRQLAVLENAQVGYTLKNNDLSTATLALPTLDGKNAYMAAHNIVRLFDGEDEVGLFRIVGVPDSTTTLVGWTEYEVEHVIATLVDDVLFGYHEIGGAGVYTGDVINYILSMQTVRRWQLGRCDYADQYAYKFENTNLLAALFSLGNVLTGDYQFEFDTSTTPWTINLVQLSPATDCEIRYRRNMVEITRTMDASALVTRLYLLGYGEGVNQLTIKSVNGGLPYIEADTIGTWGVKSSVYADTTIEDAALLKARGRAVLEEIKNPYIAYQATAVDLYSLTGLEWDKYMPGKMVHAIDEDAGIDFTARIVTKTKPDVYGDPGNVELEIANRVRDIADSISRIAERQGISELYSQGATNLYSQQYADNADASHPAVIRFYVPTGCVRINSVRLSWALSSFRAYETGAAAGGGRTATSAAGGATSATEPQRIVSTTSEAGLPLSPLDYEHMPRTGGATDTGGSPRNSTDSAGSHTHTGPNHRHALDGGTTYTGYGGTGSTGSDGSHTHGMAHVHEFDHVHRVVVDMTIPGFTLNIPDHSHTLTLPDHTHDIVYGIYEGGRAQSVTIRVDGTAVPAGAVSSNEMDVVGYLSKDAGGKISRGAWHTIEIVPDALTRIEANLFVQAFIQSVGGGDY